MSLENKTKTIFCDIDGTLVEHKLNLSNTIKQDPVLLTGTVEKLVEWDKKGYKIILVTGRRESMRAVTEKHLSELGIFYDMLIMGLGGGARILINDKKPYSDEDTCYAINIQRNIGIGDLDL